MTELTDIQVLALSKLINTRSNDYKSVRKDISPGSYNVDDFVVSVAGTLSVGEDEDYAPTASISLIGVACLAIRRMGIQRENFLKVLGEIAQEALAADMPTRKALMLDANVKEFEKMFKTEFTNKLPTATRKGKVAGSITASVVDDSSIVTAADIKSSTSDTTLTSPSVRVSNTISCE